MLTWEPLKGGVSWREDPLVNFRRARAALEADLGPPQARDLDSNGIAAHLPFEIGETSPWIPDRRTTQPPRWTVMRQDDNGNTFEVGSYGTRCEADIVADTFEARGHKQSYWVVERRE